MKGLAWYSIIIVSFSILSLIIDVMAGTSTDVSVDLWGAALYIPIFLYLALKIKEQN